MSERLKMTMDKYQKIEVNLPESRPITSRGRNQIPAWIIIDLLTDLFFWFWQELCKTFRMLSVIGTWLLKFLPCRSCRTSGEPKTPRSFHLPPRIHRPLQQQQRPMSRSGSAAASSRRPDPSNPADINQVQKNQTEKKSVLSLYKVKPTKIER